jgi:acetyltransferase-like isoleucine patch superfamily enzyme
MARSVREDVFPAGPRSSVTQRRRELRRDHRIKRTASWTRPPPSERFAAFGDSVLTAPARVRNPQCISIGDDVLILENSMMSVIHAFPDVMPRLVIEDGVRIGRGCGLGVVRELVIERGATLGDFVLASDTFHPFESYDRLPEVAPGEPIRIGAGAVLGSQVIVFPGVTIGAGARIEHRAVVSVDVEPDTYFAGHPAWRRKQVRP